VQDAMPPGPPAPVDLQPRSYYDTAGPDWVWGEPTGGARSEKHLQFDLRLPCTRICGRHMGLRSGGLLCS